MHIAKSLTTNVAKMLCEYFTCMFLFASLQQRCSFLVLRTSTVCACVSQCTASEFQSGTESNQSPEHWFQSLSYALRWARLYIVANSQPHTPGLGSFPTSEVTFCVLQARFGNWIRNSTSQCHPRPLLWVVDPQEDVPMLCFWPTKCSLLRLYQDALEPWIILLHKVQL